MMIGSRLFKALNAFHTLETNEGEYSLYSDLSGDNIIAVCPFMAAFILENHISSPQRDFEPVNVKFLNDYLRGWSKADLSEEKFKLKNTNRTDRASMVLDRLFTCVKETELKPYIYNPKYQLMCLNVYKAARNDPKAIQHLSVLRQGSPLVWYGEIDQERNFYAMIMPIVH